MTEPAPHQSRFSRPRGSVGLPSGSRPTWNRPGHPVARGGRRRACGSGGASVEATSVDGMNERGDDSANRAIPHAMGNVGRDGPTCLTQPQHAGCQSQRTDSTCVSELGPGQICLQPA